LEAERCGSIATNSRSRAARQGWREFPLLHPLPTLPRCAGEGVFCVRYGLSRCSSDYSADPLRFTEQSGKCAQSKALARGALRC
jgi:hypothetical protein